MKPNYSFTRRAMFAVAVLITGTAGATAEDHILPTPTGKVVLTVEGKIGVSNGDGVANFDLEMLENLDRETITTTTPWFDGTVTFEGALLSSLMETVKAQGDELIVTALNDYQAPVPIADFTQYGTILAYKRDGEYMPISDKGPLFIIYPYSSDPELNTQKYFARSVWQVRRLTVK